MPREPEGWRHYLFEKIDHKWRWDGPHFRPICSTVVKYMLLDAYHTGRKCKRCLKIEEDKP